MPNQINSKDTTENLLSEQSQAWLNAWLDAPSYCHYFAVGMENCDPNLMGDWNAPFYTLEEAQEFKNLMQGKHPESPLFFTRGVLSVDSALNHTPNKFWRIWQKKHKQRIENICKKLKGGSHNA